MSRLLSFLRPARSSIQHRLQSTRAPLAPLPREPIPTHAAPAPWQRGAQALGFVLAGIAGVYSVLFYDFDQETHCFVPIRKEYAALREKFLTLPETPDEARAARQDGSLSKAETQKRLV